MTPEKIMSIKLQKRLSSKKKKFPKCSAQTDLLCSLGLEACSTSPLDPTSMLDISTWALENCNPVKISDLPYEFLHRLWLLSPDARSPSISSPSVYVENGSISTDEMKGAGGDKECAVNPLDLVTAVFMSSNTFLQQEIVWRMVRSHFAVPLVLANVDPEENARFLLWPLRSVFSKWRCYNTDQNAYILHEGELASTPMPLVSCVRLGHCNISKSQILNLFMQTEAFLHKGSAGGQQPHRLANGMVEIAWYLPSGDANTDMFPAPVVLANLHGDACAHEKSLTLLSQASSVVVIFCGNLQEKEKQLVDISKNTANKLIIVDLSDSAEMESNTTQCVEQSDSGNIPSLLQAKDVSVEDLANRLCSKLKCMIADTSTHVTLLAAAQLASKIDLSVDEGPTCRKAMALAEQVLEDFDKGSAQYQEKQLPLQGPLWRKLSEIEKEEKKHKDTDLDCQNKKKEILEQLSCYKMTPAMKTFTDALFTSNKMERTYFLNWMKLKLTQMQDTNQYGPEDMCNNLQNIYGTPEQATEAENRKCVDREQTESFSTDSTFETVDESAGSVPTEQQNPQRHAPGTHDHQTVKKQLKPETFVLGLQHFLREMGLIYQLTHIKPSNIIHNVLQLPRLAVELLLYGVPLEIMDGDASNIPVQWLTSVFAELQRLLPQEQLRTRVLTTLGSHRARSAEVLSAIFNVRFYEERNRCTRGIYLLALRVPANLKNDLKCDFLLLLDVEGLCSGNDDVEFHVHDNEMATVATGLADVLIENVSSHSKFDHVFTVLVNALLRIRDCAPMPICQIVSHDENICTILQSRQFNRVLQILQTKNGIQNISKPTTVIGPWNNESLSEAVDAQYGTTVMALKNHLISAIKESFAISEATSLPLFMVRLCAVWDAVRANLFSVSLQNTDIALSFSLLCTELSQWENTLEEHMERWLMEAIKKIFASKTRASDPTAQNDLLNQLMDEAHVKVISEVDAVILKLEDYWVKDQYLKMYSETLKPALTSNMEDLRARVTHMTKQRLMKASENNCSSFKMKTFGTVLKKEQEIKLCELIDYSRATKILQDDQKLEEEFESVWCKTVTTVDLRPFEIEDITPRVKAVLLQNLNSRGLHKYMKNVDKISQTPPEAFQICDEHTAHQSRMKHMFKEHRKNLRSQTQQVASSIIDQYNHFVAAKYRLQLDFSDSYITELLEIIEKKLNENNIEARLAFEADLKVYLCSVACKDFQKLHDSYTKDKNLLERINATKTTSLAEFVYQFRKRDQGQRAACAFTSQVIKPVVLDYIYAPLGKMIVAEMQSKHPEYHSPLAFYRSSLEELLNDNFENFVDFLFSYDTFRENKIQESVLAHLSESSLINKWILQRLGEIIGKIASAVSQIRPGHNGTLSDTKLLLEDVCLALEIDIDMDINRAALDGPLFGISTDWDRFVTCLMEEIAAMRLQLSQEFSQPVEGAKLLQNLPTQPQDYFMERLRGCEKCCPSCRAPCEVNDRGHEVHRVSLHRPKGLLPPDLSVVACNIPVNTDACAAVPSPDLNMSICCEAHSTNPALYWRYVLAKFSEQHQTEIPEEWREIAQEEALDSLKEVFNTEHGS